MAEEKHLKDVISVISITLAESVAYPLTTALTRVQARQVGVLTHKTGPPPFIGGMSLFATAPTFFLKLVISDSVYPYFHDKQGFGKVMSFTLTSLVTDAIACFIRTPAEIYRQQMQAAVGGSPAELFSNLMGHRGPLGLWHGLTVFYLREIAFNSGRMATLLTLQEHQRNDLTYRRKLLRQRRELINAANPEAKERENQYEEMRIQSWLNIAATLPLAILTTPLDVLKTRVMAEPLGPDNKGAWGHFREILAEEGVGVLFRGMGLRVLYIATVMSIFQTTMMLSTYPIDKVKDIKSRLELQDPTRPDD